MLISSPTAKITELPNVVDVLPVDVATIDSWSLHVLELVREDQGTAHMQIYSNFIACYSMLYKFHVILIDFQ